VNTKAFPAWSDSPPAVDDDDQSPPRRFFGVVARPQTYRNIAYLLLDREWSPPRQLGGRKP